MFDSLQKNPSEGMLQRICAIAAHPLSNEFASQVEKVVGAAFDVLTTREIRAQPIFSVIAQLRRRRLQSLYLVCEDDAGRPVIPVLKIFAMTAGAAQIFVITPDLSVTKVTLKDGAIAVGEVMVAAWKSIRAVRGAGREIAELLSQHRVECIPRDAKSFLFIKATSSTGSSFGGALAHFIGVIGGFSRAGKKCYAATIGQVDYLAADVINVPVNPPPNMAPPFIFLRSASEMNIYRVNDAFTEQLRARFDSAPPAIIYQRQSLGIYCGIRLSRVYKVPLIVEYNGSEVWVSNHWGTPLAFEKLAYDVEQACLLHAHVVVCVSEALRQELIEQRGIEPKRIVCHPNGVDPDLYDPEIFTEDECTHIRNAYGFDREDLVVTFIGSFGKWHGVDVLARAIRYLIEHRNEDVKVQRIRFLLIGDGAYRSVVENILGDIDCAHYVALTGAIRQEKARVYLAASDIFVAPTIANDDGTPFFGSPTKLFEYLAMARPVIASDLDQIGTVLQQCPTIAEWRIRPEKDWQGECGIRVTPGDASELAEAILEAASNSSWRAQAGIAARQLAKQKFSWDHHVGAVLDYIPLVFPTLMNTPKPPR